MGFSTMAANFTELIDPPFGNSFLPTLFHSIFANWCLMWKHLILWFALISCVAAASRSVLKFPVAPPVKKSTSGTQLANFFAGGLAGTIASTLTMPLEIVKTQLQSSRMGKSGPRMLVQQIMKNEGPKGFFKGLKPMIVGIVPTRAIYFWAYSTSKASLSSKVGDGPLNHILSAFAAGITSNTVMNPLWMVKTRFQIMADASVGQRAFTNYRDVAQAIYKEEGIPGFFKGITASYVGCFEGAIQWIVYEKLKSILSMPRPAPTLPSNNVGDSIMKTPRLSLSRFVFGREKQAIVEKVTVHSAPVARVPKPAELFLAAAVSKGVAILATYPHEVVRTRLREQATMGVFKYRGFLGALTTIAREEGRSGLYGGMGMHLLRSVPNAAVMFLSYELVSSWLNKPDSLLAKFKLPVNNASDSSAASAIQRP